MEKYYTPATDPAAIARAEEALEAWKEKNRQADLSAFDLSEVPSNEPLWVLSKRARAARKAAGLPVTKRSK